MRFNVPKVEKKLLDLKSCFNLITELHRYHNPEKLFDFMVMYPKK